MILSPLRAFVAPSVTPSQRVITPESLRAFARSPGSISNVLVTATRSSMAPAAKSCEMTSTTSLTGTTEVGAQPPSAWA